MKSRVSKKEVLSSYSTVLEVGYCDLQHLLSHRSPIGYTAGRYGWNADIYDFGSVAICTGYRPFGRKIPRKTVDKYEKFAKEVIEESCTYADSGEKLDALIGQFLDEALAEAA